MPYKSKEQNREYMRAYMKERRAVKPSLGDVVKPVRPQGRVKMGFEQPRVEEELDADGNAIPVY